MSEQRMTPERLAEIDKELSNAHLGGQQAWRLLSMLSNVRAELNAVTRERDEARNALGRIERTGGALALLLHPEMGMLPRREEVLATIQAMNRECSAALASDSAASNAAPKREERERLDTFVRLADEGLI